MPLSVFEYLHNFNCANFIKRGCIQLVTFVTNWSDILSYFHIHIGNTSRVMICAGLYLWRFLLSPLIIETGTEDLL